MLKTADRPAPLETRASDELATDCYHFQIFLTCRKKNVHFRTAGLFFERTSSIGRIRLARNYSRRSGEAEVIALLRWILSGQRCSLVRVVA